MSGSSKFMDEEQLFVWQRGKLIGRGRYGKVYCGLHLLSATMMAVKQVRIRGCGLDEIEGTFVPVEEESIENIVQEIQIGLSLYHPHVVEYYGAEQDGNIYNIYMEYLPLGSVSGLIKSFGFLDESIIATYASQLLQGLRYLHSRGIAHRDLKCANLLLCDSGCIKIADFGAAKLTTDVSTIYVDDLTRSAENGVGSPFWMSPEIIRADARGSDGWTKSDIWSVGCCVIEMATGKPPWSAFSNPLTAMFHIASETTIPDLPTNLSSDAQDFLIACFTKDPELRPAAEELLQRPFFRNVPQPSTLYGWYKNSKPLDGGRWWFDDSWGLWYYWVPAIRGFWFTTEQSNEWIWWPEDEICLAQATTAIARFWLTMARQRLLENRALVRVVADYSASDDTELSLAMDDVVVVTEMDENGWWRGHKKLDTLFIGWVPCTYVEWLYENIQHPAEEPQNMSLLGVVRAVSSYEPTDPASELCLTVHELLFVLETPDDGWWCAQRLDSTEVGWFPCTYVEWLPVAICSWVFEPSQADELAISPGDSIAVIHQDNESIWCEGINLSRAGARGWFPSTHVSQQMEETKSRDDEETKSQSSDEVDDVVEYNLAMDI
ncbi:hypothetical protein AeRB84_000278 [Aphanomyces euteiches]|nr:hypothetical protein AeRB84_000278 [Aphanomyces euteiches]